MLNITRPEPAVMKLGMVKRMGVGVVRKFIIKKALNREKPIDS